MIEFGVAQMSKPGYESSGDNYVLEEHATGLLAAVIDGLGHGDKACVAAQAAVETLKRHPTEPPMTLLQRCHKAMTGTRGAVISIATITNHQLAWVGVGNVEGVLLRADAASPRERLLLRGGIVGYRMPTLRTFNLPVHSGDTLILATDGIRSAFADNLPMHLEPQGIAQTILEQHSRKTDDALVLVVRC